MFPKYLILFLASLLCSCTTLEHYHAHEPEVTNIAKETVTSVSVVGDVDIRLVEDKRSPVVSFEGKEESLKDIEVDHVGSHLNVLRRLDSSSKEKIIVKVNSKDLCKLSFDGSGVIRSNIEYALDLDINSDDQVKVKGPIVVNQLRLSGNGKVHFDNIKGGSVDIAATEKIAAIIEGVVSLSQVQCNDEAWVKVFWNDSPFIKVAVTDKAFLQMAGKVNTLDAVANQSSHLNARYLRTDSIYLKTYAVSRADVFVNELQHVAAFDQSNIYTYNTPEFSFAKMISGSSVLDMRNDKR